MINNFFFFLDFIQFITQPGFQTVIDVMQDGDEDPTVNVTDKPHILPDSTPAHVENPIGSGGEPLPGPSDEPARKKPRKTNRPTSPVILDQTANHQERLIVLQRWSDLIRTANYQERLIVLLRRSVLRALQRGKLFVWHHRTARRPVLRPSCFMVRLSTLFAFKLRRSQTIKIFIFTPSRLE